MSTAMVDAVAKLKSKPEPDPIPEPEASKRKPMIVQVRGSEGFKTWTEELARFDSRPLALLVERALRRYAKEIGFDKEAPER